MNEEIEMKTKVDLLAALDAYFGTVRGIEQYSCENYGYKSCVYIPIERNHRSELENLLISKGFKVNENYWPGHGVVEVQVKYFSNKRSAQ
jgi:hypothetical protein